MSLSIIIITKNEQTSIARCLESVVWADQIVVVDSGSSDGTVELCRAHRAQVTITADWPGFGMQKNRALALATGDWVLSLDADEWLSPASANEIRAAIAAPGHHTAFDLPRRSSYCGRWMQHSGWWPDYVRRLFRRGTARFSDDLVHERLLVEGAVGRLREPLLHESFADFEEVLEKTDRYSSAAAAMLHARGKHGGLIPALLHAYWTFVRTYLFKRGFLDGREGFMLAVSNAEGTYYKYLKLMRLARASLRQK